MFRETGRKIGHCRNKVKVDLFNGLIVKYKEIMNHSAKYTCKSFIFVHAANKSIESRLRIVHLY